MLARLFPVKKGEGRTVFFLMLYLVVVCVGTSLGIAVSTSMLLEAFGAEKLPYIFVGISFCSLISSSLYTLAIKKLSSSSIYKIFLPIAALTIFACNLLLRNNYTLFDIAIGIIIQYIGFFVFLGIDIINFNNYSSTYLNPIQKKRLYSFILSATKMGGILGGLSLSYLLKFYDQNNVLLLWPMSYLLSMFVLIAFESKAKTSLSSSVTKVKRTRKSSFLKDLSSGVKQVKSNRFYLLFASIIALDICCGSLIIYQFNEGLSQVFSGRSQDLSAFLGQFCAIANIVALTLQMFVAPKLSQSFGVTKTNFLFPCLSLLILIISLFSWKLTVITLLMFHKDYIMSVFHFPNRAQFYNGVESQKKGFFLGFFEGIWTHSVNMCFGIILIFIVQVLPRYFPVLKEGFSFYFSIVGICLFSIYIIIAYKLVSAYKKQLVLLMSSDDVQTKIRNSKIGFKELKDLFSNNKDEQGIYDFLSSCETKEIQEIIQTGNSEAFWKIMELYPSKFHKTVESMTSEDKFETIVSSCNRAKEYGFIKSLSGDQIISQIDSLNIRRSAKYFDSLFMYLCLFDDSTILKKLEPYFFSLKEKQQLLFLRLSNHFKNVFSDEFVEKLLSQLYKQSLLGQEAIFQSLSHRKNIANLSNLLPYFESSSQSIRNSVLDLVTKLTDNLQDSSEILEYYFAKKWSSNARSSWFDLFSSLDGELEVLAKQELFNTERSSLMDLLKRYVALKSTLSKDSTLLEVLQQDIYAQLKFFLQFFEDDFDKDCLRIVDKSLLDINSTHKYEAIELLTSTDKKEICSLLMPFLECTSMSEVLDALYPDKDSSISLESALSDIVDGDCAWTRALAIYEITNLRLTTLKDKVLSYANCTSDLYSGEMVEYCINEWSLQNEME